nr:hypothetical protein ACMD2_15620 [Ipomoea batatas]
MDTTERNGPRTADDVVGIKVREKIMNMWTDQDPIPLTIVSIVNKDLSSISIMDLSDKIAVWARNRGRKGSRDGGAWRSISGASLGSDDRRGELPDFAGPGRELSYR